MCRLLFVQLRHFGESERTASIRSREEVGSVRHQHGWIPNQTSLGVGRTWHQTCSINVGWNVFCEQFVMQMLSQSIAKVICFVANAWEEWMHRMESIDYYCLDDALVPRLPWLGTTLTSSYFIVLGSLCFFHFYLNWLSLFGVGLLDELGLSCILYRFWLGMDEPDYLHLSTHIWSDMVWSRGDELAHSLACYLYDHSQVCVNMLIMT